MLLCTKRAQKGRGLSKFLLFTEGVKKSVSLLCLCISEKNERVKAKNTANVIVKQVEALTFCLNQIILHLTIIFLQ